MSKEEKQLMSCLQKVKTSLASRGASGILGIGKKFKIIDDDGSGKLNKSEFQKAMRECGVGLSDGEVALLFKYFDVDGSGEITYDEFVVSLRGELNPFRKELVHRAFAKMDNTGNGIIDVEDLQTVFNVKGHPEVRSGRKTEAQVLRDFLDQFDSAEKDGEITLDEFEKYYSLVSASIDDDAYFQLMMWNTWNLGNTNKSARGERMDVGFGGGSGSRPGTSAGRQGAVADSAPARPSTAPSRGTAAPVSAPAPAKRGGATPARGAPAENPKVAEAKDKMKQQLQKRGARGIFSLGRVFRIMDDDRSGSLSFEEFKKGMHDMRVDLNDQEIRLLFNSYDTDGNGSISYDEFLIGIRGELNSARRPVVVKAFRKLDKTANGVVDLDDLRGVYSAVGHPDVKAGKKTEEEVLLEFLDTFDCGDKDGQVTQEEFEKYYANLSASVDRDDEFVLIVTNAWKLDAAAAAAASQKGVAMQVGGGSSGAARPSLSSSTRAEAPASTPRSSAPFATSDPTPATPSRGGSARLGATSSSSYGAPASPVAAAGRPGTAGMTGQAISRKLKENLSARGASGIVGLGRQFRIMDDDGSRQVNRYEFTKAMRDYGVGLTDNEITALFNHYDKDGSGELSYDEFLVGLRGELNPRRKAIVSQAFAKLDNNGNGIIEIDDITALYNAKGHFDVKSGKRTEEQVLRDVLDAFDSDNKDGTVTLEEFESYYATISANIDDDNYFQLMMWNAWNLGGAPKTPRGSRLEI